MASHTELYLDATESESSKNACTGTPSGVCYTSVDRDSVEGQTQGSWRSHVPLTILLNDFKHVNGDTSLQKHKINSGISATDQIDIADCEHYKNILKEIKAEAEQFGICNGENENSKKVIDLNDTNLTILLSSINQLSKSDKQRLLLLSDDESGSGTVSDLGSAVINTQTANTHYFVEQVLVPSDNKLRIESGVAPQTPPQPPQPTDVSNWTDGITVTDSSALYISTEPDSDQNIPWEDIVYPQDTSSGQIVVKEASDGAEQAGPTLTTPPAFPVLDTQRRHKRIKTRRARDTMDFDSPEYKEYLKGLDPDNRKRELNKQAAKRCRDKKFCMELELEQRAKRLRIQHEKLVAEKTRLVSETSMISFRLDKHNHCQIHQLSN